MPIHHEFRKGQKILVILRDGSKKVGKFSGTCGHNTLNLEDERIPYKNIRAVTIYKANE